MKRLLLIDGSNLLFRAYYATAAMGNMMQNSQGLYTNGIYGLVSSMQQVLKMDFTHLLVALDPKGKTHRHLTYEAYKGTRKEAPSELIMQFPYMAEYLESANIPYYSQDTFEADDIIGYCAKHFKDQFDRITIISNDHDLMQLLDKNIDQLVSRKGFSEVEWFTPESMMEKLGIRPDQMIDYKGLVGDTSDNIPGIKGIGDKTAQKLLADYGTLENVFAHLDDLKGKLKERLEEGQEIAKFSKELATIVTDFDAAIDEDFLAYHGFDLEKLAAFYQKMEFHGFLRKLPPVVKKVETVEDQNLAYQVLTSPQELAKVLTSPMSIHLELLGPNYHTATPLSFGLSNGRNTYVVDYALATQSPQFQEWLKDPKQVKYAFDLKAQKVRLLWDGLDLNGVQFDLLLAAYLINPNLTKDDFKVIVTSFDYHDVAYDEDIYGKGAKYGLPEDFELVRKHVADKARAIYALRKSMLEKNREYEQMSLLEQIEIPLAGLLSKMEFTGIAVDQKKLEEIGEDLTQRASELETLIYDLAGSTFNVNSPKQLGEVLFEQLQLPYQKKTKTGYSTDASVLKQLSSFHPIIDAILEYRSLTKLNSTYVEGLRAALSIKNDGRIHTIYRQAQTQTGRLSSVEPNLQNIPIKTEEGKELRKLFVADQGGLLYSCDYSQIELRVLAEMADVKALKEAFQSGEDVHSATAKKIFKTDQVTSKERRQAKAINFGIIYGKTSWGLAEDLQISPKKADEFIKNYFETYPEIKTFMDQQIQDAIDLGYVSTLKHRRRYIPEVRSNNYQTREFGKRMAMNAPIQGSAADLLKIAMVAIQEEIERRQLKSKMLLQIHDELVFSVPLAEKDLITELVHQHMEHAVDFSVPLTIEGEFGLNLYEVK
ncbi:MAG: DNA polymerase I [Candidatus Izemoplasmatales bacterium]